MKNKIISYLKNIEKEKDIKILLACETGSRAWGFPSPDSDYDIRMIYMHKKDWYLSLNEKKDTIEIMLENNNIDIAGWELRKSLRLLWKSNPPLLERIQSPILYLYDNTFLTEINKLAKTNYSKIASIHHYLGIAKKSFAETHGKPQYNLKRFFYALRTAIACKWILERNDIPPIQFDKMLAGLDIEPYFVKRINKLIQLKSNINESYLHSGDGKLMEFIASCIDTAEDRANTLSSANKDQEELDIFFRKILNKE